ncbi:hypothetical protein KNP414_04269 [Paenibacillus mucilaginosus KNP414]|uniref:Uncharacterized protein n=1 Tax=Paenibacillus mucilaginosus (strain KNP414) TaxID=1036673 RepID=F8FHU4_PAEMK|nr:hypothetical protein KNP414_04269 [Paenibacillus mucilaginosus KNP414]
MNTIIKESRRVTKTLFPFFHLPKIFDSLFILTTLSKPCLKA